MEGLTWGAHSRAQNSRLFIHAVWFINYLCRSGYYFREIFDIKCPHTPINATLTSLLTHECELQNRIE